MRAGPACHARVLERVGCGIKKVPVRILSDDFGALHVVAAYAESCADKGVEVTKTQTTKQMNIQVAALTANSASPTVPFVATGSILPLLNDGLSVLDAGSHHL